MNERVYTASSHSLSLFNDQVANKPEKEDRHGIVG